jgi:hypothetical protein
MLQKYAIFLTRANITLKNLVVSKITRIFASCFS